MTKKKVIRNFQQMTHFFKVRNFFISGAVVNSALYC